MTMPPAMLVRRTSPRGVPPLLPSGRRPASSAAAAGRCRSTPTSRSGSIPTGSTRTGPRHSFVSGSARRRPARSLLRWRAGLGLPPAAPRAHPGGRVPLLRRCPAARLPARRRACASTTSWGCSACTWIPEGSTPRHGRLRVVPGRGAARHGLAGGSPRRHGRRRGGPGHGAGRGARADGRPIRCCARGSSSSSRRQNEPLPRARRRRPGFDGHPRPAPLRRLPVG